MTQGESSSSPATTTTDEFKIQGPTYHTSQIAEMYHVASHLNSEVRLCNNTRTVPWPPHHTDFNLEKCQNAIPPVLFNHMALILGFVDAHHTSPERASFSYFRVHGEARRRLISICQDILFFQSRGTKPTQKAMHADSTSPGNHVIIHSPDTDVAILSLHFAPRMKESVLWFATGTKDKKRVLSISNMATHLGEKLTDALPGIHAFTGCDSVSSFHGKGKKSGFTLASQDQHIDTFTQLGLDYTIAQDHFNGLEAYVCQLYRAKSHSVNDARYELFCSSTPEERSLPPNRDCLMQHAKRASYQTKIWRSATEAITNCPSPDNHGWDVTAADGLQIRWMDGEPAPAGVLKDSSCSCKKGCGSAMCSCKAGNMKCSDLCRCTDACTNKPAGQDSDEEVADSDSDDEV